MNVVIKNQNYKITDSLNIEVIKTLSGEFSLDDVTNELVNFFYNKIIIDITAIKNYYDINSVIYFLRGFDPSKVIILLNDSEVINGNSFLSKLVENGYYNFTRNAAGVNYLIDNPNSIDDVEQYTKVSVNTTSFGAPSLGFENGDPSNFVGYNEPVKTESTFDKKNSNQKIIGVQNLTEHAGSTTLAYMMIKQLKANYQVKGIEMNKQDFVYFRDSDLALCTSIDDLKLKLKEFSSADVVIIDLNDFDAKELCDEVLYLVEPGTLRLNKLMKKDSNVLSKVINGKVILNRSSIKTEEVPNFEYETKFKVFFNLINFDDRKEKIQIIDQLLYKLGFSKQKPEGKGLFGGLFS